ncbi:IS3 family transposase [Streptomyces sp. NPDC000348]|uniref:IS3 family transposase n=1 Tax=Streptomyces sp. NPDC000348 TaxID=3364538 RepID=UPI00367D9E7C
MQVRVTGSYEYATPQHASPPVPRPVYAFIEAERTTHTVALLCRLLKVARSSFCAWRSGEQARRARQAADDALAHEITVLHVASRHTYGVPRIHAELRRLGRRVNRWGCPRLRGRVERVMRERGITGVTRRRRRGLNAEGLRRVRHRTHRPMPLQHRALLRRRGREDGTTDVVAGLLAQAQDGGHMTSPPSPAQQAARPPSHRLRPQYQPALVRIPALAPSDMGGQKT